MFPFPNNFHDFNHFRRGTNVMLCANHRPILNDVTHAELQLLLYKISKISPVISNAISTGRLTCFSSGQASPCLDLSRLNKVHIPKPEPHKYLDNLFDSLFSELSGCYDGTKCGFDSFGGHGSCHSHQFVCQVSM